MKTTFKGCGAAQAGLKYKRIDAIDQKCQYLATILEFVGADVRRLCSILDFGFSTLRSPAVPAESSFGMVPQNGASGCCGVATEDGWILDFSARASSGRFLHPKQFCKHSPRAAKRLSITTGILHTWFDMKIEHFALQVAEPVAIADWYKTHLGCTLVRAGGEPTRQRFLSDNSGRILLEFY